MRWSPASDQVTSCSDPRSPTWWTRPARAKAALAGFAVARAWRNAPRPTLADDLLPERAFAGDPLARATLINRIYKPLQAHSTDLLMTLWSYLDNGRSLEATARELFVHPNTVRYRLKRVSEVIGWDATGAREALILQAALIVGSIAEPDPNRRRAVGSLDHRGCRWSSEAEPTIRKSKFFGGCPTVLGPDGLAD